MSNPFCFASVSLPSSSILSHSLRIFSRATTDQLQPRAGLKLQCDDNAFLIAHLLLSLEGRFNEKPQLLEGCLGETR